DANRIIEAKPVTAWAHGGMVAAANPLAVQAGVEILAAGGSAVDAAIAVQAVLGLTEPQSSGLGGGAFMLHYDAATGDVQAYDGREIAPAGATPTMFLGDNGQPLNFWVAVKSGRSVGVPGAVAMLKKAWDDHGELPWAVPWMPAGKIANEGFAISPRFGEMIAGLSRFTEPGPDLKAYLFDAEGRPLPVGHILRNPAYAATVREIAERGPDGFYKGWVAEEMVASTARGTMPGSLSLTDLAAYRPVVREPVCSTYRTRLLCGMGPPSSGGIAVLSTLGILENFDMASPGPDMVQGYHRLIEAQRLAYADRDTYVADDGFVSVPVAGLLDRTYLRSRAALINDAMAAERVLPGDPPGAVRRGRDATGNVFGTSHFVVVDAKGNVVSMTTTVEAPFGSQRMAGGFFLNNQLTDFSFRVVDDAGQPIANAPAPGKKPRSSMSPTIVFDANRQFELAVGSPGGNSIIGYVTKTLVAMLDWGMVPDEAIGLPNVVARTVPVQLERGRASPGLIAGLEARGHRLGDGSRAEGSGLHAVRLTAQGLVGGADVRREGVARRP
ncbi:MAG: gamma-glutamyltransferase, partial [Hyphomonadaceae bacterium]|nr:gamma-glutamyltransferase [Hyphomonadaceae bacterium]